MEKGVVGVTRRISVTIFLNGEIITPETDGYLGRLTNQDEVVIEITVDAGRDYIYGIEVDGKKNIYFKKDHSLSTDQHIFKTKIPIKVGLDDVPHTEYPNNNLRIIRVYKNGKVEMWEIALMSRGGSFFLTTQKTYEVHCYRKEGKIFCPHFSKWPQMMDLLCVCLNISNLPPIEEYQEKTSIDAKKLAKDTGIVQWWNNAQGVGMIMTSNGPARVHWKNIFPSNSSRLTYLTPGGIVKYKALVRPQQTKARSTAFRLEAVGVSVV
jgi:cold shock CspA family protein